jgi:hypothetical protein
VTRERAWLLRLSGQNLTYSHSPACHGVDVYSERDQDTTRHGVEICLDLVTLTTSLRWRDGTRDGDGNKIRDVTAKLSTDKMDLYVVQTVETWDVVV